MFRRFVRLSRRLFQLGFSCRETRLGFLQNRILAKTGTDVSHCPPQFSIGNVRLVFQPVRDIVDRHDVIT